MKTLLLGFALVLFTVQAQAQRAAEAQLDPSERAEEMTTRMTEVLNLTTEQVAQVEQLNNGLANDIAGIKDLKDTEPEAFRNQRRALRKAHRKAVRQLLTAEQQELFREHFEKNRKDKKKRAAAGQERRAG